MGVLSCDRNGCENIMCDFYSHTHGYLCYECKEELVGLGPTNIEDFMQSEKWSPWVADDWKQAVDIEFKSRYEDN